jgi:multidrug transporter EmrE-like cation transporter
VIKTILYCLLYAILNVSGAAIIKLKLRGIILDGFKDWVGFLISIHVLVAFSLIFISALVMFKALSSGTLSFTVPVATGINFALTIGAGHFIFKDNLNLLSFVGFVFILLGIIILSFSTFQNAQ